jgi:predicted amidophosphoribosyltransferase
MQQDERRKSVRAAYYLKGPLPAGCRVQLWDDTLTTGATLQAMAGVLYRGGAAEVHGATLARAD